MLRGALAKAVRNPYLDVFQRGPGFQTYFIENLRENQVNLIIFFDKPPSFRFASVSGLPAPPHTRSKVCPTGIGPAGALLRRGHIYDLPSVPPELEQMGAVTIAASRRASIYRRLACRCHGNLQRFYGARARRIEKCFICIFEQRYTYNARWFY